MGPSFRDTILFSLACDQLSWLGPSPPSTQGAREGYAAASAGGMVVVLDTRVTDELRMEGLAREVINRIQNARKTIDPGGFTMLPRSSLHHLERR